MRGQRLLLKRLNRGQTVEVITLSKTTRLFATRISRAPDMTPDHGSIELCHFEKRTGISRSKPDRQVGSSHAAGFPIKISPKVSVH